MPAPDPRFDRVHNMYVCGLDYECSCDECRKGFPEAAKREHENKQKKANGSSAICRFCKAEILWVTMSRSQKRRPLDPEVCSEGSIWLDADGNGYEITAGANVFVCKFKPHNCRKGKT